jgi:hypothetical protein
MEIGLSVRWKTKEGPERKGHHLGEGDRVLVGVLGLLREKGEFLG